MGIYNDYEIPVASRWETSATITAGDDWFSSALGPIGERTSVKHSIQITLADTPSLVRVVRTRDGVTKDQYLNAGNLLTNDSVYIFDIILRQGDTYNIKHDTGTKNHACDITESSNCDI